MDALVAVFHAFTLTNLADDPLIEPLDLEFESSDPESIIRLQDELFAGFKFAVDTTGLERVYAEVLDQQRTEYWVVH